MSGHFSHATLFGENITRWIQCGFIQCDKGKKFDIWWKITAYIFRKDNNGLTLNGNGLCLNCMNGMESWEQNLQRKKYSMIWVTSGCHISVFLHKSENVTSVRDNLADQRRTWWPQHIKQSTMNQAPEKELLRQMVRNISFVPLFSALL